MKWIVVFLLVVVELSSSNSVERSKEMGQGGWLKEVVGRTPASGVRGEDGLFAWEDEKRETRRKGASSLPPWALTGAEVKGFWGESDERKVRDGNSVWFVSVNGSDSNSGANPDSPFKTIQKALDESIDGDLIEVAEGTYPPSGNSALNIFKSVYIRGASSTNTIINLNYEADRFAHAEGAGLFRLESLTLLDNSPGDDGDNQAMITFERCGFLLSSCYIQGGQSPYTIRMIRSVGSIYDSSFVENAGPILVNHTLATFISCVFEKNTGKHGAGIRVLNSIEAVLLRFCTFISNSASYGAGIYVEDESSFSQNTYIMVAENITCVDNTAEKGGGCLYSSSPIRMVDSSFFNNTATDSEKSNGNGGAVYLTISGQDLLPPPDVFVGCYFTNNSASVNGGGIYGDFNQNYRLKPEDYHDNPYESLVVSSCNFESNSATEGGAISLTNANATFSVNNSLFQNNDAIQFGGAIFVNGAYSNIETSNFTRNAAKQAGGAVVIYDGVISDSSFSFNAAAHGACSVINKAIIRLSVFNQNPSGGVNVVEGATANIDDCQLSVQDSPIGALPDLGIAKSARVLMSGVSSVSLLSVKGTLILVGPTGTNFTKDKKLVVGTLEIGDNANIQMNTNITVLDSTTFHSNVVFFNQSSLPNNTSWPDCWFFNKGTFVLTSQGGSGNGLMTMYWNNISFMNEGNLTLENATSMIFDDASQFRNMETFVGNPSASITTTSVQNFGTLYLPQNTNNTHQPFIINGDLVCESGSKIDFITDSSQQLLQVNGQAQLDGTAFFDTVKTWEGPVMTYSSRQGTFKKHVATKHHATLVYYEQFVQATIGRGAGLTGGWVVGGAVLFVLFVGVGVVLYKYSQYKKNRDLLIRQQTEQEDKTPPSGYWGGRESEGE